MGLWSLARWVILILLFVIVSSVLALVWSSGWDTGLAFENTIRLWGDYAKIVDRIYDFVDRTARFIVPIATIGGAVYGIYHKWQYGKSRMHIHIAEFLKRDDKRLAPTGKKLSRIIERPGPDRQFASPVFLSKRLEPALKDTWGKLAVADRALSTELGKLGRQLEQWWNLQAHYNKRRAQAHLIKGAIAAGRAASRTATADTRQDDVEAFEHFKNAYELNKTDAEALEYMAHQRLRLGDLSGALIDFEELQAFARRNDNQQLASRALMFQATTMEQEGATRLLQNPNGKPQQEPNLQEARDLLAQALDTLPGAERGGLHEAELFELRGRVNKQRLTRKLATDDYTDAERLYFRISGSSKDRDIVTAANAGLNRVRAALQEIRLQPLLDPGMSANGMHLPSPDK